MLYRVFLLTNSLICVSIGRKSNADSKSFVCGWYKHINTNIVWDSTTSSHRRILYLCANYHFNHLGQSLRRWHYASSGGWFITNLVFFIVLSFLVYQQPFLAIWFVINVQKFKRIMRGTQGALIVASSLQIIVGFSGLWCHVVRSVLVTLCFVTIILLSHVRWMLSEFILSVKCGFSQQSNIWSRLGKINRAFKPWF